MPTLGLAMIVRDEEEVLARCLESVRGIFDEIVVTDTGSKDRTKEILASFGAKVHDFEWIDHFAAARNFSFSKATADYVMWMDADDVLLPADRDRLLKLKAELGSADAYMMVYDYCQDEFGNSLCRLWRHRVVRNRPPPRWNHPIHECMQIPPGWAVKMTDVVVTHKRTDKAAQRDSGRNLRLLTKAVQDDPSNKRMKFYLGKELYNSGLFKEAIPALEDFLKDPDWEEHKVQAVHFLAMSHYRLGPENEKKVVEKCLTGIHMDPRWAEFYVLIGEVHYNRKDWAKAAAWYEMASKMRMPPVLGPLLPDNYTWVPHDRLCKCYAEIGRVREAYEENEKALVHRPGDKRFLYNREYLRDVLFGRLEERPFRLNLGGGAKPVPSYRRTDLYPGPGVDFVFDQCSLPYHDGTVHAIYSEHALEHAPGHAEARAALGEWARAIRHGGHLVLKVPDLDLCCEAFARAEDKPRRDGERWTEKEWYRYTIYGIQQSQGAEPAGAQHHRTGFTKAELRRLLEAEGFRVDLVRNYDGWGTPSIEAHAVQIRRPAKVRWLVRGGAEEDPSTRIRRLNVSRWFASKGVDSSVCETYAKGSVDVGALVSELRHADVVVFTQPSADDLDLMDRLNRCGVATIYDMNEDLDGNGVRMCLGAARRAVFCSTALTDKYGKGLRGTMVPDAYELPKVTRERDYAPHGDGGKVRVVFCGMGGNAVNLEFLRPIVEELGMELLTITEWPDADRRWKLATWLDDLSDADIAIAPQRIQLQPAKSNTKATQAMALGLPVVTSPLAAYKEAIRHGETGFICDGPEEWRTTLRMLRDDPALRERIGRAARLAVGGRYSIEAVGLKWLALVEELSLESCSPPKVDIIIPTFNNLKYLQACIDSIRTNTDWPHNIIVVDSGSDGTYEWLQKQPDIIFHRSPMRLHFASAMNAGLAVAKEKYVCLLNDDVIVAQGWLGALMHEAMKPDVGAVGPFSNCDKGWLHHEEVVVDGISLGPGMAMEQVERILPEIQRLRRPKEVHERPWLAFYCAVVPREAIDKIGLLDVNFKSGDEDLDYCRRLAASGYRCLQTYDSFVFHFGGRTRKFAEGLDPATHHREDRENHEYFQKKWGAFGPGRPNETATETAIPMRGPGAEPLFVLYTGQAWEEWSPKSVDEGGIGGSETCAVYVAREFAKKGWRSVVFGDCQGLEGEYDGVEYVDYRKFENFISGHKADLFVSSRRADILSFPVRADRKVCWVHDIWVNSDPNADVNADKFDTFFVLSPWHREFFLRHQRRVPAAKVRITRNGIDLGKFSERMRKIPGRLVYSSSPDRGLDTLLDLFPRIQREVPEAELHVFYGFDNWEKSARSRGDKRLIEYIESLKRKIKEQPGVVYRGRVGQKALAREFLKAELLPYPTWFTETFCLTVCEAMAAGTPVVCTDVAALATTVGDAGIVVPVRKNENDCGIIDDRVFQDRFVEECVRMLTDRERWAEYSRRGLEKAKTYSWDGLVDEWLSALDRPARQEPRQERRLPPKVSDEDLERAQAAAQQAGLWDVVKMIDGLRARAKGAPRP